MGLHQKRPLNDGSECQDAECDAKNLTWHDGSPLTFDSTVFDEVNLAADEWCVYLQASTQRLRSSPCSNADTIKTVCQVDCRPGMLPGCSTKRVHFFQNSIAPTKKHHDASTFDI